MNPLENLVRAVMIDHERDAPSAAGLLDAVRQRDARRGQHRQAMTITLTAALTCLVVIGVLIVTSVGAVRTTGRSAAPAGNLPVASASAGAPSTDARPCPGLREDASTSPPASASASAVRRSSASTPATSPQTQVLAEALDQQGHGAFADVFGLLIVDQPVGRVGLCVTDATRGAALAQAAKNARPDIDLSRLDIYRCDYSQRTADAAIDRLIATARHHPFPYPTYRYAFSTDAAAIEVTTTSAGSTSEHLRSALLRATGGIPVRLITGGPDAPL